MTKANDFTMDSTLLVGVGVGGEGGSEEFWNNKGQEDILQSLAADEELL